MENIKMLNDFHDFLGEEEGAVETKVIDCTVNSLV